MGSATGWPRRVGRSGPRCGEQAETAPPHLRPYMSGRRAQMPGAVAATPSPQVKSTLRPICASLGAQMTDRRVVGEVEASCLAFGAPGDECFDAVDLDHIDDQAVGKQAVANDSFAV